RPAGVPGGEHDGGPVGLHPLDHRDPLRGVGLHRAAGHQEAGGLLEREPPGLRGAGHLHPDPAGHGGRHHPDGEPRPQHRRALPHGRHDLRATAHPAHRRLRRALGGDPRLQRAVPDRVPLLARAARSQWLRGGVPDPARHLPGAPARRGARQQRHHLRGGVPALDVPAGVLRRGDLGGEPAPHRPEPARVGGAPAGAALHRVDRGLPDHLHHHDRAERAGPHHPGADQGAGDLGPADAASCCRDAMNPALPALVFPSVDLRPILPMLVIALTAGVVLVLDLLPPRDRKDHLGFVSALGVVAALIVTYWMTFSAGGADLRGFRGMVVLDAYALFFNIVIGYAAGLVLLFSMDYIRREGEEAGEFYILVLLSALGMMLMASAGDLIIVFLGLETMSISLYVLAGLFRTRLEAGEASMKYLLIGAFASGFFLYGIALIFGATGTTNLDRIANAVAAGAGRDPMLVIGLGLLLVGFGFKISSVPFHMWAPDVYEGAPTSVTAFIATGSKAAAFAALLRVLLTAVRAAPVDWPMLLWVVAALTMTVGNVVALAQQNLKRMLAYSSIAHVGYMLVGVVAGGAFGNGSGLFYLLVYPFTPAGAFGAVLLLERAGQEAVNLADFGGLAARHPMIAVALSVFLLSLVGIPPTAGFVGKFYLFGAAVKSGYVWLAVIGVVNSAAAAYYYLRLIVFMYMREPEGAPTVLAPSLSGALALVVALWGVVQLGVAPGPLFDLAQAAVIPLLR